MLLTRFCCVSFAAVATALRISSCVRLQLLQLLHLLNCVCGAQLLHLLHLLRLHLLHLLNCACGAQRQHVCGAPLHCVCV
jgi:hypothetical protein